MDFDTKTIGKMFMGIGGFTTIIQSLIAIPYMDYLFAFGVVFWSFSEFME